MAYSVSARTQEMVIRMSLGARHHDIVRLMVGQGTRLTLIGVILGLAASLAMMRLISALLFGVHAADPLAFAIAAVSLIIASVCACYVPARRAVRVDPIMALRCE
jgi:putative ABC transport system permease protein